MYIKLKSVSILLLFSFFLLLLRTIKTTNNAGRKCSRPKFPIFLPPFYRFQFTSYLQPQRRKNKSCIFFFGKFICAIKCISRMLSKRLLVVTEKCQFAFIYNTHIFILCILITPLF